MYPDKLNELINALQLLSGVGEKSAERYALEIMKFTPQDIERLATSIQEVQNVKQCQCCGNYSDEDICSICKDTNRDKRVIMVVQEPKDIMAFEKTETFRGVYHVLNGLISPSKGIMPNDLNIQSLLDRIDEDVEEVILAINATIDGETTAMYLSKLLADYDVTVSKIANGIPIGGQVDYADALTLTRALEGRNKY